MGKWFALPTWLVTSCFPLPKNHPWYNKRWTLQEWYDHETDLCREFDFGFWLIGTAVILVTPLLIWRFSQCACSFY